MKFMSQRFLLIAVSVVMLACESAKPPVDNNGQTPQDVLMNTYMSVLEGDYDSAMANFSDAYIEEMITKKHISVAEYFNNTREWKKEWLKVKLVGNKYNDALWRVKIIPDEGKGAENGPGVVQDLYMIDGSWKIVFWGHYPQT